MGGSLAIGMDDRIKRLAQQNVKQIGLDVSNVMRMLLQQPVAKTKLPQGLAVPNAETLRVIYELENKINTKRYSNKQIKLYRVGSPAVLFK